MPGGNGTGPMGMGPMTGRGAGFAAPGYANPTGRGFGRGRGFRQMFCATGMPGGSRFGARNPGRANFAYEADEKEFLKRQASFLENQLYDVKKRLDEFKD